MINEKIYQIALTLVKGIGSVQAKILIDQFKSAKAIFSATKKELSLIEGIGELKASQIKKFADFKDAEAELSFLEKYKLQSLFITDIEYPQKLLTCYDPPTLLYFKGNANLNNQKSISIIGTRANSDYGKQITEKLIDDLQNQNITIYSGLAFGIDSIAHKSALKNNISTIGVLAHGLDSIYPVQHKSLAKEMILQGGLLTEFRKNTKADKHNFPKRNRIVAGISDATIVIETNIKGGSMITAELAYNYNKDLFAIPGKITDLKSSGCLKLIQQNKAVMLGSAEQLLENMGWQTQTKTPKKQRELFIDLTDDERIIIEILKQKEATNIDEIYLKSQLASSTIAGAILNLELQNVVVSLPGKIYKLI